MPVYVVTDPQTGRKVRLTADTPPTAEELTNVFGSLGEPAPAPAPSPSPEPTPQPEPEPKPRPLVESAKALGRGMLPWNWPGVVAENVRNAQGLLNEGLDKLFGHHVEVPSVQDTAKVFGQSMGPVLADFIPLASPDQRRAVGEQIAESATGLVLGAPEWLPTVGAGGALGKVGQIAVGSAFSNDLLNSAAQEYMAAKALKEQGNDVEASRHGAGAIINAAMGLGIAAHPAIQEIVSKRRATPQTTQALDEVQAEIPRPDEPVPEIGPGKSEMPEPVFPVTKPTPTPARGEGASPPPTPAESGAPVKAATPAVTGPPAEGAAGPAIRPTTTEVAPSQVEAKPAAPSPDKPVYPLSRGPTGLVDKLGRPVDANGNLIKPAAPSAEPEGGTPNASRLREDARQVQETGVVPQGREGKGGKNLEQPTPGEPGGTALPATQKGEEGAVLLEPARTQAKSEEGAEIAAGGAQGKVRGQLARGMHAGFAVESELRKLALEYSPAQSWDIGTGRPVVAGNGTIFIDAIDVWDKTHNVDSVVRFIQGRGITSQKSLQRIRDAADKAKAPDYTQSPLTETVYRGDTGASSGSHIGVSVTTSKDVAHSYGDVSEFTLNADDVLSYNQRVPLYEFWNRGGAIDIRLGENPTGAEIVTGVTGYLRDKYGDTSPASVGEYLKGLGWKAYRLEQQSFVFDTNVLKPKAGVVRGQASQGKVRGKVSKRAVLARSEIERIQALDRAAAMRRESAKAQEEGTLPKPAKQLPPGETGEPLPMGPGAQRAGEPRYEPITRLVDQLKQNRSESLPEDIALKERLADSWSKTKTSSQRALARMVAVGESIKGAARGVLKPTDVERRVGELDAALQTSVGRSIAAKKAMRRARPNITMRRAAALYQDAGGDLQVLSNALATLPEKTPAWIRRALELAAKGTDEVKQFASEIDEYYSARKNDAVEHGIFEHGLDDYFTHIWRDENNMPASLLRARSSGQVSTYFQFGRQRKIPTFLEGIAEGKVPELDPADVLPFYNHALDRAIASRAFVKQLSEIDAADGRPVVSPSGIRMQVGPPEGEGAILIKPRAKGKMRVGPETPPEEAERLASLEGYESVNHPAMRKWKWAGKDDKGNDIFYEGDLLVHPDHYERIARMMDRGRLTGSPIGRVLLKASSEVKGSMFGLPSTFHAIHVGLHGAFHWTNPFKDIRGGPIDWEAPATRFAIEKGHLKIAPNPGELAQFSEGMMGRGLVSRLPGIKQWSTAFTEWMFQDYIPKLKLRTFDNAYARAIWAKKNLGLFKGLTDEEVAARTGDSVNNAYGELNRWFLGKHGREPWVQRMLQGIFLAPDFGEARLRFAGKALSRYGHEERLALATMFIGLYTAARVANVISSVAQGQKPDPQLDPKHAFDVKVGDRWYGVRSVIGDLNHAMQDFGQFMFVRLNPLYSRTIIEGMFGRDIYGKKKTVLDNAKDLALTTVPIGFRGIFDPNKKLWETFMASMGVTPRLQTPVMEMNQLVRDWKKRSTDPTIQAEVKRLEGSVFPPSDYEPLRRALYNDDRKAARQEVDKLMKTPGRTFPRIIEAIDPFHRLPASGAAVPKSFTHHPKLEPAFLQSLTPQQRVVYDKAVAQRQRELVRLLGLYQ